MTNNIGYPYPIWWIYPHIGIWYIPWYSYWSPTSTYMLSTTSSVLGSTYVVVSIHQANPILPTSQDDDEFGVVVFNRPPSAVATTQDSMIAMPSCFWVHFVGLEEQETLSCRKTWQPYSWLSIDLTLYMRLNSLLPRRRLLPPLLVVTFCLLDWPCTFS